MVEAFAEVLGDQVSGCGGMEAVQDEAEGDSGVLQGFEVAGVGDECGFGGGAEGAPAIRE